MQDGFVKVAAVSPRLAVADVVYNVRACAEAIQTAASKGAKVVVLPELCVTGATCGDLFWQDALLTAAADGVARLAKVSREVDALVVAGAPLRQAGKLYSCAFVLSHGRVLGIVPKRTLAASQVRQFACGPESSEYIDFEGTSVPFGANRLFACTQIPGLVVAVELGEDLNAPLAPAAGHALAGATLVVNLSASAVLAGSAAALVETVAAQSRRLKCAYMLANAGVGESTTDYVYGGQCLVAENGHLLAEAKPFSQLAATTEVDVELLVFERLRDASWAASTGCAPEHLNCSFSLAVETTALTRVVDSSPFTPTDTDARDARCKEVLSIQAHGLARRMAAIGSKQAVIGVSGGLDSTLALLVTAQAFDLLGLDRAGICAITMPGFGTTDRTHNNAWQLAEALGATPREIAIGKSVRQHFADIGHDESVHNAAYENAQARERTQILMDVANDIGALVVGTGDLSELALGWATYNGDHMSMYSVNATVPKTLIRHIVRYVADTCKNKREAEALLDVLDTPVSPELLPANTDGTIAQQTEDLVGPYELHDFFVYHVLRHGFAPNKIARLATEAFVGTYDRETVEKWLEVFYRRFFSQQFKRSCAPDGPATTEVGLSPRGGLAMPSDASSTLWQL